jgi:Tfp pilus assembly protein PilX
MKKNNQGALLMTVMVSLAIVGVIAGAVASLVNAERKLEIRQQLKLHSMAAAEAAIDYAYSLVTNDANLNGLDQSNLIPPNGSPAKLITFSDDALNFLKNKNNSALGGDPVSFTDIKVSVLPRPATQVRVYIDPKDATNPNRGQCLPRNTHPRFFRHLHAGRPDANLLCPQRHQL